MKLEVIIGIIGIVIVLVLIGYFVGAFHQSQQQLQTGASVNLAAAPGNTAVTLTAATVAQHATAQDCWLIINRTVYAVTSYLNKHPGGRSIIIPFCGQDATTAFATKAGQGSHSSTAAQELASLSIGQLNSTATVQDVQQADQRAQTLPAGRGGDGENEREFDDD